MHAIMAISAMQLGSMFIPKTTRHDLHEVRRERICCHKAL